jgi:hypothetical protein
VTERARFSRRRFGLERLVVRVAVDLKDLHSTTIAWPAMHTNNNGETDPRYLYAGFMTQ